MNLLILREAFPEWKDNKGIFEYIQNPPWQEAISPVQLNLEYFGNISGSKKVSPLVKQMMIDGVLDDSSRQSLALLISAKFRVNWTKLWETEVSEYNPVHNYNMTEESQRHGNTSGQNNLTDETNHGRTSHTKMSHWGFNSQGSNPADETTSDEGGKTTVNHTGGVTSNSDETSNVHRYGNIGVTTSQQMIEAERNIRMWNYFNSVYKDIDSVLAIRIYDMCSSNK